MFFFIFCGALVVLLAVNEMSGRGLTQAALGVFSQAVVAPPAVVAALSFHVGLAATLT